MPAPTLAPSADKVAISETAGPLRVLSSNTTSNCQKRDAGAAPQSRQPAPHITPSPVLQCAQEPLPLAAAPRREDDQVVRVRGSVYQKLLLVGKGGSSKVYKVIAQDRQIYALKRIKLSGRDPESARGFVEEITLLKRLQGKRNIIQLVDAEVSAS